jgi:SAM-dependent methyltransferase
MSEAICEVCGAALSVKAPLFHCTGCNAPPRRRSFHRLFREGRMEPRGSDAKALGIAEDSVNLDLLGSRFAITTAALYGRHGRGRLGKSTLEGVDIRDLAPFADATFDLVTAIGVLDYVGEADRAFASVARVLRPGGLFVLHILPQLMLEGDTPPRLNKTLFSTDTWFHYIPRDVPISTFFYTIGWTAQALRDAGFTPDVITHDSPVGPQTWFLARRD